MKLESLKLSEVKSKFELIGTDLRPAGIWEFKNNKKEPINAFRPDKAKWSDFPNDNMAKFRIEDTPYLIIDADGIDIQELETIYPSLASTFYTITTSDKNRHYYLKPPINHSWPRTRTTRVEGPNSYDLLSFGILFEAHCIDQNENYFMSSNQIIEATEAEYKLILSIMKAKKHESTHLSHRPRVKQPKLVALVRKYLEDPTTLSRKDRNDLIKQLTNEEYREQFKGKGVKKWEFPPLGHMEINTMAYKLVYTEMSTGEVIKFLHLLLQTEYNIDINSQKTKQHLDKSILASLPSFEAFEVVDDEYQFTDILQQIKLTDRYAVLKTIKNRIYHFIEVDCLTLKPRRDINEAYFLKDTLKTMYQEHLSQAFSVDDLIHTLPEVRIIDSPYESKAFFDVDNDMMNLNIAQHSIYREGAIAQEQKPDNVISRAISSYFGEYEEIYYHYLAHLMYGKRPPQMILLASTPNEDAGGSGKTTVAAGIPSRLIYASHSVNAEALLHGWGNITMGKTLVMINDMQKLSKSDWSKVYARLRDESTAGLRRSANMKYGGFVQTTDSTAFSVSANFMPSIEEHDRRLWVVKPQHLLGKTAPLSNNDALLLNQYIERTPLDEFIPEFQEIANYLLYLFQEQAQKFYTELFIKAPETEYREECILSDEAHSQRLTKLMLQGPEALESIIDIEYINEAKAIYRFMLFQWEHNRSDYISLPWQVMAELLMYIQGQDHKHSKPASVASALGISNSKLTNTGSKNWSYKDKSKLLKYGIDPVYSEYSTSNHYKLPFDEDLAEKYRNYLI